MLISSIHIAAIALAVIFAGAVAGMLVGRRLPEHHLSPESKTAVSVSMAVVGTMTALVIGLLISSADTSFRARSAGVSQLASGVVELDALLRRYGPAADEVRNHLKAYTAAKLNDLFSTGPAARRDVQNAATAALLNDVQDTILELKPEDERQSWLKTRALQVGIVVGQARYGLIEQDATSLPVPFLGAVTLWLTVLFASFGVFAPRNGTVVISLFLCALAISSAIKLILDMDTSFEGQVRLSQPPLHIPSEPMRHALDVLQR